MSASREILFLFGCFACIDLACSVKPTEPQPPLYYEIEVSPYSAFESTRSLSDDSIVFFFSGSIFSDPMPTTAKMKIDGKDPLPRSNFDARDFPLSVAQFWAAVGPVWLKSTYGWGIYSKTELHQLISIEIVSDLGTATGTISIPDTISQITLSAKNIGDNSRIISWRSNADYYSIELKGYIFNGSTVRWIWLTDSVSTGGLINNDSIIIKKAWLADTMTLIINLKPFNGVYPYGKREPNMSTTSGDGYLSSSNLFASGVFEIR